MRRLAALVLILLVSACTNPVVNADVTRFHALGGGPAPTSFTPASFTIVPDQPQVGSLEFQQYASQVANALAGQGWRPVAPGSGPADAIVKLSWGSGPSETDFYQTPSTVYGGMGWGHPGWYGGGFYDPFPYWETRSVTTWPLWLSVRITAGSNGPMLFEGRAVADRKSREIAPVMPYLVRALFTGFPGTTGKTVRVTVPIDG